MNNITRNILPLLLSILFFNSCQSDVEPQPQENVAIDFLDLSYGDDDRQKMDVYLPAGRSPQSTRVFVWVHGGGWFDGDKSEFGRFKPWLEREQDDYAYISLNYRLFNINNFSNPFPAQEEDLVMAMEFIQSELDNWGVSDNIVLAGASAGGHLVLLHSYKNNAEKLVKSVMAFFPATDMKEFFSYNLSTQLLFNSLIGGNPSLNPAHYKASSPVAFITNESVPTIFFHGNADRVVPIEQSYILEEKLEEKGVPFLREYLPNQGHGFNEEIYPELIRKGAEFFDQHLP